MCQGMPNTESCSLYVVFEGTFDCFIGPQVIAYFLFQLWAIFFSI